MTKQPFHPAAAVRGPVRGALWMVASAVIFGAALTVVRADSV